MTGFDAIVVAAPCQPFHEIHVEACERALAECERVVFVILGGDRAIEPEAPWSSRQRTEAAMAALDAGSTTVCRVRDVPYDIARWQRGLEQTVNAQIENASRIGLIADRNPPGLWPRGWSRVGSDPGFAAAEALLRDELLWTREIEWPRVEARVGPGTVGALRHWAGGPECHRLRDETRFIREFRASWAVAPYAPVFVTVDAIVTAGDQLLLIERGRPPGQGLWALPGGFVGQHEALENAARRELAEETGLELKAPAAAPGRVFDAPARSLRGRTITHVFRYELPAGSPPPAIDGGDDASAARWAALDAIDPAEIFEDHYAILQVMLDLP